jgi:transcriptional regulator with XRE-family HTH domain
MVLTKLKDVMAEQNMTIEELAAKCMMSARSIIKAKKERGVSLNTCKRIAKGLNMKLEQLT